MNGDERRKQIEEQAKLAAASSSEGYNPNRRDDCTSFFSFTQGAEWADANPHANWLGTINQAEITILQLASEHLRFKARIEKLRAALEKIKSNSCCNVCQCSACDAKEALEADKEEIK